MASRLTLRATGKALDTVELVNAKVMREIGAGLVSRIRARTQRGIDSAGRPFRPLSPRYASAKREALGHARADLTVSGRMLNDMIVSPRRNEVAISFSSGGSMRASGRTLIQRSRSVGAADKAYWHNVSGAGKRRVVRVFFDFDNSDEEFAQSVLDSWIREQL